MKKNKLSRSTFVYLLQQYTERLLVTFRKESESQPVPAFKQSAVTNNVHGIRIIGKIDVSFLSN